jgi:methylenetetrahydrofolate reductase (NADPH)
MALRGDPPKGTKDFEPAPDGFAHASDLIQFINENYDFSIGGACYPEGHFEGNTGRRQDPDMDLEHLFKKVKAGAKFLVTQLFYDNEAYFQFVERARMFGIEVPIIPGLMPVVNAESIPRIAKMSGASFPDSLMREVQARASDPDAVVELAVAFTALQADELLRHGAPGIHFYTLNRSPATSAIVSALRLIRPWEVHNYA